MSDELERVSCPICGMTLHNCNHTIEKMVEVQTREIRLYKASVDALQHRIDSLEDANVIITNTIDYIKQERDALRAELLKAKFDADDACMKWANDYDALRAKLDVAKETLEKSREMLLQHQDINTYWLRILIDEALQEE